MADIALPHEFEFDCEDYFKAKLCKNSEKDLDTDMALELAATKSSKSDGSDPVSNKAVEDVSMELDSEEFVSNCSSMSGTSSSDEGTAESVY